MRISQVLPYELDEVWPKVAKWVLDGLNHSDFKYNIGDVLASLLDGDKQLWVVYTKTEIVGCVITEILLYPQQKRLGIFLVAGDRFDEWFHLRLDIYDWAKRYGCEACEFYGREGWIRKLKPHFKLIHVCMKEDFK